MESFGSELACWSHALREEEEEEEEEEGERIEERGRGRAAVWDLCHIATANVVTAAGGIVTR